MKKYDVFYRVKEERIKIGEFYMEDNKQRFIPSYDGMNKVEEKGDSVLESLQREITDTEINFFNDLVKNCECFGGRIFSHVHNYEMERT